MRPVHFSHAHVSLKASPCLFQSVCCIAVLLTCGVSMIANIRPPRVRMMHEVLVCHGRRPSANVPYRQKFTQTSLRQTATSLKRAERAFRKMDRWLVPADNVSHRSSNPSHLSSCCRFVVEERYILQAIYQEHLHHGKLEDMNQTLTSGE